MGGWTKHSDWQPLPQTISKNLPICPLCKQKTKWEVHDKMGWTTRGYTIICSLCQAEWEYTISKPQDMIFGGAFAAMNRVGKITNLDSIWILKKAGKNQAEQFLEKEINFSTWKQMCGESYCGNCSNMLTAEEEFCPKCGTKKEKIS